MVRAAQDAGVRKFVFSSVYHPSISAMANHAVRFRGTIGPRKRPQALRVMASSG